MIRQYIYNIISAIAVLWAIAPAQLAEAQVVKPWDGTTASAYAGGDGSKANPYQIATAEQLKRMQSRESADYYKHFVQIADIDLNGDNFAWTPIGRGSNTTTDSLYAFRGTYDGQGFEIRNMKVLTDGATDNLSGKGSAFGLFGWVRGATIRNVVIRDAKITRTTEKNSGNPSVKYGILIGALSPTPKSATSTKATCIENIIIINSKINDGGQPTNAKSYFIGGVIGDYASSIGGYSEMLTTAYNPVHIRNIYAEVDIDLAATKRQGVTSGQMTETNVGGIFGRMRKGTYYNLPENVYYTGSVKAPSFAIGPVWGVARTQNADPNTTNNLLDGYMGEVLEPTKNTNVKFHTKTISYDNTTIDVDGNRFFGSYKVWNKNTGAYVAFTDAAGVAGSYLYGSNTISPNSGAAVNLGTSDTGPTDEIMMRFQGYNHGTYKPNFSADVMPTFNAYVADNSDHELKNWVMSADKPAFERVATVMVTNDTYNQFKAELLDASAPCTFKWTLTRRSDNQDIVLINNVASGTPVSLLNLRSNSFGGPADLGSQEDYSAIKVNVTVGEDILEYTYYVPEMSIQPVAYSSYGKFNVKFNSSDTKRTYKIQWYGKLNDLTSADASYAHAYDQAVGRQYEKLGSPVNATNGTINLTLASPYRYQSIKAVVIDPQGAEMGYYAEIAVPQISLKMSRSNYFTYSVTATIYDSKNATDTFRYKLFGSNIKQEQIDKLYEDALAKTLTRTITFDKDAAESNYIDSHAFEHIYFEAYDSDGYLIAALPWEVPALDGYVERYDYVNTFRAVTSSIGNQSHKYKWYFVPRVPPYATAEPILMVTSDVLNNSGAKVTNQRTIAFETAVPGAAAPYDKFHPDHFSEVRVVVCDKYGRTYSNDEFDPRFTYSAPIEYVGLAIERFTEDAFMAVPQTLFPTSNYKFNWFGIKHDGSEEAITSVEANNQGKGSLQISNLGDYKQIKVELCDELLNPIYGRGNKQVSTIFTVDENFRYYPLTIKKQTKPGDDDTYAYVATVKDLNGNVYMGSGDVAWNGSNASINGATALKEDYFYVWEVSSDPTNTCAWQLAHNSQIANASLAELKKIPNWIEPNFKEQYYRLSWCRPKYDAKGKMQYSSVTGLPLYEIIRAEVYGPYNLIFVYDKTKTALGRNIHLANSKMVCDFTGIDRSVYDDNGNIKLNEEGVPYEGEYPDGSDANTGYAPYKAVRTLKRAYELCDPERGVDGNIIVIMGFYYVGDVDRNINDIKIFAHTNVEHFSKPATITGSRGSLITGGVLNFVDYVETNKEWISLGAPTKFVDITWTGLTNPEVSNATNHLFLYCNLHDLYVGENLRVMSYAPLNTSRYNSKGEPQTTYGLLDDTRAPSINVTAGIHNFGDLAGIPDRPNNAEPNVTTITINSGNFGRIIAGSRNDNNVSDTKNIFASPEKPHRVKVYVGITHQLATDSTEYTPDRTAATAYHYDIGMLVGGQTDGSIYGEAEINLIDGKIGRYISGNISYGRNVNTKVGDMYPSDAFYGSTTLNMSGGSIKELYGGSLGRYAEANNGGADRLAEAYFYGRSIINLLGGTVGSDIYGAGAGGVTGIGHCIKEGDRHGVHHTSDQFIPYYEKDAMGQFVIVDGKKSLKYNSFDVISAQSKKNVDGTPLFDNVPVIPLKDGTELPLAVSYSEVNLYGGTVNGNVYGGGYGYTSQASYLRALNHAGDIFGNVKVTMETRYAVPPRIKGNIYGGGAGSTLFYDEMVKATNDTEAAMAKFGGLARVFGKCEVSLKGGIVEGDVFGGSMGVPGFSDMATVFGDCYAEIDGATVLGNIFGGCDFANIVRTDHDPKGETSGNTYVTVKSGTIGNNIFGGGRGCYGDPDKPDTDSYIIGNTNVVVEGGDFINTPYINMVDNTDGYRTFNIYGGGYINCRVNGNANVNVSSSLMNDEDSFIPAEENPNGLLEHNDSKFHSAYMDITYRRFCVYGGGFGEKTNVRNTNVYVTIPPERPGATRPHGRTLSKFYDHQSFFDIAGGGYSGDVGYWAKVEGNDTIPLFNIEHPSMADYDTYVGGACKVTIDGYTYARKIIGGGFYGSCYTTDTKIRCGSLRQVYGGSLLGYVHKSATLNFGNNFEDPEFLKGTTPQDTINALNAAKELNQYIFITENIYGGNDVKGIIGTQQIVIEDGNLGIDNNDNGPLFQTDIDPSEDKGIIFNIYGGTFQGDVYGAGNGHYRGYYVPEWVRYEDGPDRMYRKVRSSLNTSDPNAVGKVYRSRPMVGSVNINIRGNSDNDSITIIGNFYGGGRECTIGQFNTFLPAEDPRRLMKGGHLHVNIGGHTHVQGNFYMGVDGGAYTEQPTIDPAKGIDLSTFDGSSSKELERLGDIAYSHWYFNGDTKRYEPGYPAPGKFDGNFGMTGEHMFRGYMKNIEMQGDIELTFYRDLYDSEGNRKRWLPGEEAIKAYDADHITMNSFFLGGRCGSMSNNDVMVYDYTAKEGFYDTPANRAERAGNDLEQWGTIYRITMPRGVTINDVLCMGVQDATTKLYPYNSDFSGLIKTNAEGEDAPYYVFDGGMVTRTQFTYDLIIYNDMNHQENPDWVYVTVLPDDFYTSDEYRKYRDLDIYKLGDRYIHRYNYPTDGSYSFAFPDNGGGNESNLALPRYSMGIYEDNTAVIGIRETRTASDDKLTVVKLTAANVFDPVRVDAPLEPDDPQGLKNLYGGLIYGGCYRSGLMIGDVILNVASNMLGKYAPEKDRDYWYSRPMDSNLGRIYGGGFGADSRVEGSTYVNLLNNVKAMYAFGGGMMGPVLGTTSVTYVGSESSYVFGAIYGGSLRGAVGIPGVTEQATFVDLVSGNVDTAYGGSCVGDLYGSTYVTCSDRVGDYGTHLDFNRLFNILKSDTEWGGSRLYIGSVYGGNDISGTIYPISPELDKSEGKVMSKYASTVHVYEQKHIEANPAPAGEENSQPTIEKEPSIEGPGKKTPGAVNGYNGFPVIGNLYGGSNANYGVLADRKDGKYGAGTIVTMATGNATEVSVIDLGNLYGTDDETKRVALAIPDVPSARIMIDGGTIVNAYAGGNMSTITDLAEITVDYDDENIEARAGFSTQEEIDRVWSTFKFGASQQRNEVVSQDEDGNYIFDTQIFRLFGGNNNADMDIQPVWNLQQGYVSSLYSGGNFGRMTYYNAEENKGLSLTIDSDMMHVHTVFGGGRVGDIMPHAPTTLTDEQEAALYGATLNINRGVIDHVYGGNDVSGKVLYGANVNITGAISGDVYCAGNGNYVYKYDPSLPQDSKIQELYDEVRYGRYFVMPQIAGYGDDDPSAAQKILAINAWRPNIDKASLYIEGGKVMADKKDEHGNAVLDDSGNPVQEEVQQTAYVRGNVYCGGNSSTISPIYSESNKALEPGDIKFKVGNNVVLNGVFLGSNGENLINPTMIYYTGLINQIDFRSLNLLGSKEEADLETDATGNARRDAMAFNKNLYPHLFDLYMRAVDVLAIPKDFDFDPNLHDAYIGDFFVGGNSGSMLTDETISLTFPEALVVYGKIVGGSNNSAITYNDVQHWGGLPSSLKERNRWSFDEGNGKNKVHRPIPKVHLTIKNRFEPWKLDYPVGGNIRSIKLIPNVVDGDDGAKLFPESVCSIFGGCYDSGVTLGNIQIDLFTDMTANYDPASKIGIALAEAGITDKKQALVDGLNQRTWRSFSIIGAGYGANTRVNGDVRIRMLPGKAAPNRVDGPSAERPYAVATDAHPSVGTLFGGGYEGVLVGNTTLELRDGTVLTNMYGASQAAAMYGSSQTIIGWPKYYVCKNRGNYKLDRTDKISRPMEAFYKREAWLEGKDIDNLNDEQKAEKAAMDDEIRSWTNFDLSETYAVRRWISCRPGDIVSIKVWSMMSEEDRANFLLVDDDAPDQFSFVLGQTPAGLTWDDIDIHVGDSRSRSNTPDTPAEEAAPYYGHGNVYGGGYIDNKSNITLAGQLTVRRFTKDYCPEDADVSGESQDEMLSYGGNSTILIWDNYENADLNKAVGSAAGKNGATIKDHITIGTGRYVKHSLRLGEDVVGMYRYMDVDGFADKKFVHQSPHVLGCDVNGDRLENRESDPFYKDEDGNTIDYYAIESDGGIYGGGRNVFVEAFRTCDISYYGYADSNPQFSKLLNTIQRFDMLTIRDCCMQLQGANDYAHDRFSSDKYSLSTIGELNMESSLALDKALDPGVRETVGLYNILHNKARTRNYLAFYKDVRYLAAVTSNVPFDAPYRGANGQVNATGDYKMAATVDENGSTEPQAPFSYKKYKQDCIDGFYNTRKNASATEEQLATARKTFDQRNLGTSANMIGMNNGYSLRVQGSVHKEGGGHRDYYGPITGVVEVKLLTLARNEGGGYVFALNQHDNPNNFLQTTGNCVFPGAAYLTSAESGENYNYVYDDCFPLGQGWEHYYGWKDSAPNAAATSPAAPYTPWLAPQKASQVQVDNGHGDCNELQEVHYWYVNGTNFTYNVTLTGHTFNEPMTFSLDNVDQLIYLYGVDYGTKLKIKSVTWHRSHNEEPDLVYGDGITPDGVTRKAEDLDYRFMLSVDNKPSVEHSLVASNNPHAFVSELPRTDYDSADGGDAPGLLNNYSEYESGESNLPLLGITLRDEVDNSGREYYQKHLEQDETGQIVLVTTNEEGVNFKYSINLTVMYVLGPTITGNVVIENAALPGEYVYANSYGIEVDLDDKSMFISERNWYVIDKEVKLDNSTDIRNAVNQIKDVDYNGRHRGRCLNDQKILNDRQIHIPAYLYLDSANLVYEIVANGESYFRMANPTEEEKATKHYKDKVYVHNYHRMHPYDGTSLKLENGAYVPELEDLKLTAGARVYIEDDADMAHFYTWLKNCQGAPTRKTEMGLNIDPQCGDSIYVFLMNDVKMPEISVDEVADLEFRGTFHGAGHNIDMGQNLMFLGYNSGQFYNTGFISSKTGSEQAIVFNNVHGKPLIRNMEINGGRIENCFFFNSADQNNGYMLNPECREQHGESVGTIINCYRTSLLDSKENITSPDPTMIGLVWASLDDFEYGEVGYNLNRFYLNRRYANAMGWVNSASAGVDDDTKRTLKVMEDLIRDGEYRFARVSDGSNPTALRTAITPNYHDYRGIRLNIDPTVSGYDITGFDATMHNDEDLQDNHRAANKYGHFLYDEEGNALVDVEGGTEFHHYEPRDEDYYCFGQDLATYSEESRYPHGILPDGSNRIYRASGFYGSKIDQGFYFNANANAVQPTLTAIDFAGLRMAEHNQTYSKGLKKYGLDQYYYAPVLDLPKQGLESFVTSAVPMVLMEELRKPGESGPEYKARDMEHLPMVEVPVTRNLLVYAWNVKEDEATGEKIASCDVDAEVDDVFAMFDYQEDYPQEAIFCHLINPVAKSGDRPLWQAGKVNATKDYFHLVDMEEFDCPIAFNVEQRSWYERDPEYFSMGLDGWEGLVLPFTVDKVNASLASDEGNVLIRNHGELSHFYGEHKHAKEIAETHVELDTEADSHEYWLRKFTGYAREGEVEKLYFARPGSEDDKSSGNPADRTYESMHNGNVYHYSNTYFSDVYGGGYTEETSHSMPPYTAAGIDYPNYPMITETMPYIVSFPGYRFYEFDLSGNFYVEKFPDRPIVPQRITFSCEQKNVIPVTSDNMPKQITHDGFTFCGTYMKKLPTAYTQKIMSNEDDVKINDKFERMNPSDVVWPFRAYMTMPTSTTSRMLIASRGVEQPGKGDTDEEDLKAEDLEFFIDDNTLVIMSPYEESMQLPLYDANGRLMRYLHIEDGANRYPEITAGYYLVRNFKFRIM